MVRAAAAAARPRAPSASRAGNGVTPTTPPGAPEMDQLRSALYVYLRQQCSAAQGAVQRVVFPSITLLPPDCTNAQVQGINRLEQGAQCRTAQVSQLLA